MRPSLRAGVLALGAMVCALAATPGAQELEFGGSVEQLAGIALTLDSSRAAAFGSATSLNTALRISGNSLSVKVSGKLSVLYGSRASSARAGLALEADSRIGVLTLPGYDPDSYNPANPDTSWFSTLSLSEAVLSCSVRNANLEIGKTIVNWGVGKAFSPVDFFSGIDFSGGNPSRRASLIGRVSWFPGPVSRVELAAKPFSAQGGTYAIRAYSIFGERLALALAAGFRQSLSPAPSTALAGIEFSLDLPYVAPYGELASSYSLDDSGNLSLKAMAGGQSRIGDLSLLAEYGYDDASSSTHRGFFRAAFPVGEWVTIAIPIMIDFSLGSSSSGIVASLADLGGIAISLSATASRSLAGTWSAAADLGALVSF